MKKFLFRFETLLTIRRVHESNLKRELEYVTQKWNQAKEKEKMLLTQISALLEEIQMKREKGEFSLQQTYSQILEHLNLSLESTKQHLEIQIKQIESQKERLTQAVQARKVIEKIKEKHYTSWRIRASKSQEALLDEISLKKSE